MSLPARAVQRSRAAAAAALLLVFAALLAVWPAAAATGPKFPQLTGRVVDAANILPPQTEAELTARLERLEQTTQRQLVVATLPDLQGYEIEEYGYQLGRAWGIGRQGKNDGALLLVAPKERKVRVEVGYGLEGVLTDALSSAILQGQVLPRFRQGDLAGGVVAGTNALIEQLSLDQPAAQARVAQAEQSRAQPDETPSPFAILVIVLVIMFVLRRMMGGRRRRSAWWIPPLIIGSGGWRNRGGGWGGGGFGGGGGGFGGGGGSFGGGGSSGSW